MALLFARGTSFPMAHVLAKVAAVQGVGSRGTMAASGDG
jgi:hypothetical protein